MCGCISNRSEVHGGKTRGGDGFAEFYFERRVDRGNGSNGMNGCENVWVYGNIRAVMCD